MASNAEIQARKRAERRRKEREKKVQAELAKAQDKKGFFQQAREAFGSNPDKAAAAEKARRDAEKKTRRRSR